MMDSYKEDENKGKGTHCVEWVLLVVWLGIDKEVNEIQFEKVAQIFLL